MRPAGVWKTPRNMNCLLRQSIAWSFLYPQSLDATGFANFSVLPGSEIWKSKTAKMQKWNSEITRYERLCLIWKVDFLFLDTVLQCCPAIFGRFAHLDAHFFCRFPEFGRGVGNFFEKQQNKSCCFQNVFNFLAANFLLAAGIFRFFSTVFSLFSSFPFYTYLQ